MHSAHDHRILSSSFSRVNDSRPAHRRGRRCCTCSPAVSGPRAAGGRKREEDKERVAMLTGVCIGTCEGTQPAGGVPVLKASNLGGAGLRRTQAEGNMESSWEPGSARRVRRPHRRPAAEAERPSSTAICVHRAVRHWHGSSLSLEGFYFCSCSTNFGADFVVFLPHNCVRNGFRGVNGGKEMSSRHGCEGDGHDRTHEICEHRRSVS